MKGRLRFHELRLHALVIGHMLGQVNAVGDRSIVHHHQRVPFKHPSVEPGFGAKRKLVVALQFKPRKIRLAHHRGGGGIGADENHPRLRFQHRKGNLGQHIGVQIGHVQAFGAALVSHLPQLKLVEAGCQRVRKLLGVRRGQVGLFVHPGVGDHEVALPLVVSPHAMHHFGGLQVLLRQLLSPAIVGQWGEPSAFELEPFAVVPVQSISAHEVEGLVVHRRVGTVVEFLEHPVDVVPHRDQIVHDPVGGAIEVQVPFFVHGVPLVHKEAGAV